MILFGLTFRCALRARSFGLRVQLTASHGVLSVVTIHYRKSESGKCPVSMLAGSWGLLAVKDRFRGGGGPRPDRHEVRRCLLSLFVLFVPLLPVLTFLVNGILQRMLRECGSLLPESWQPIIDLFEEDCEYRASSICKWELRHSITQRIAY